MTIPRIKTFIQRYLEADEIAQAEQEAENLFWEIAGGAEVREVWQVWASVGATHEQFWDEQEIPQEKPNVYEKTSGKHDEIWKTRIRDNPHNLIRLARNPYLLAMLMDICQPGEAFPSNRGALLEGFYQQLIRRENKRSKDHADLLRDGGKQLEALIGKLAWAMAEQTQTSSPRYETLTIMEHDEQWLKLAIRCNVLEQIGDNIRFSHQLLQDYFIAVGMKQRLDAGTLPAEQFWRQDGDWWQPTGWEEPVILLAGLYQDCTPVVEWLAQANPKLAARCILDSGVACVPATIAGLAEPWLARLNNLETDPNPHARAAIGAALAWLALDKRKGVGLDAKGLPDIDWVEIPDGKFVYPYDKRVKLHLDTFWMSRYPVTNVQFQAFVVAVDGYNNGLWWQDLKKPDTLHEPHWKESNRPVESVGWYEAIAFCRWLSNKMNLDIRLPTEGQWEKAASYPDDREYPWGNNFESDKANVNKGLGETSTVGIYPNGQSYLGLMDMVGNVWEWCLNKWDEPQMVAADLSDSRNVVCGGSWYNSSVSGLRPPPLWLLLDRYTDRGFRLLCCLCPH